MASAATAPNTGPGTKPASSRKLLGGYGFIPQGCNLVVAVSAAETQRDWFGDAPEIRGRVTLSNPNTYGVPLDNIIVQARSSDGQMYSTVADCGGGSGVTVPANPVSAREQWAQCVSWPDPGPVLKDQNLRASQPNTRPITHTQIPYQYGTATCGFRIVLDRRVFGSYGSVGSGRRLQGDSNSGKVQVNFFPGAGGSDGGSGGSGVSYFPPSGRASWTVVAIASVSYSGSQCVSAPTPINTDCWWQWLWQSSSWFAPHKHHHHWGGFGRKLMSQVGAAALPAIADTVITTTGPARKLASADDGCASLVTPTSFIQRDADGSHSVIGRVTIANPGPVPLPIKEVKVVVANTIAFRPMIVVAQCGGATAVPAFSATTCSYAQVLPSNGASSDPGVWTSAVAQTLVGSGTQCNSAAVPVYRA